MKTKGIFLKGAVALAMVLLLVFPKISLEGARAGLLLWYQTVLPTLLPFMICTNLITAVNGINFLIAPAAPFLKRLLGLSDNGCFILLNGILCGYPMGAKNCSDFLDQGCISPEEAKSLYAVSSFPSPMFLAGFVMAKAGQAAGNGLVIPFWKIAASMYLPLFPLFFAAGRLYGFWGAGPTFFVRRPVNLKPKNFRTGNFRSDTAKPVLPLDEALMSSITLMVKIGGYLMIFSVAARYIQTLLSPGIVTVLLIAAAEMTTGIDTAAEVLSGLPGVAVILAAAAFGGFSGVFQVKSVTKNVGLSIRHYILWKLVHSLTACALLVLLLYVK